MTAPANDPRRQAYIAEMIKKGEAYFPLVIEAIFSRLPAN